MTTSRNHHPHAQVEARRDDGRPVDRVLAGALLALGAALALNTMLGPLITDSISYDLSDSLRNQMIGLEAVSLFLVAPLCVIAAVLTMRGRIAGPVIGLGPATYSAYMLVQYIVGPGYEHYPRVLAFHVAIFVLSGFIAVRAWTTVDADELPPMSNGTRRHRSWMLIGLAVFVVLRYLPALLGSVTEDRLTTEFRAEPAFFWTILLMDLGIVVPCAIAAATGLRRHQKSASKLTYGLLAWFALVPPSVAAMAAAMVINNDPNKSVPSMVLFTVAALAFAFFAVHAFRPLLADPRP